MERITVAIAPEITRTRLLVSQGGREVLKAMLMPATHAHPKAISTLLEGLALWHQTRLSVVLCADAGGYSNGLDSLCEPFGYGERTLHYDVAVAQLGRRPRRRHDPLGGIGDFRDLQRLSIAEAMR